MSVSSLNNTDGNTVPALPISQKLRILELFPSPGSAIFFPRLPPQIHCCQRVEKSSGTLYWRVADGTTLAETDASGNTINEYIYFAGTRIARRDSSGNVYYYFANALGSPVVTNATGSICYDADFYLFGGESVFTNTCGQNYKFAGMERDPETGNDHTLFRSYRSNYGRWLSPDPAGLAAVDPANPQSWNRYAYVMNNPVSCADLLGLGDQAEVDCSGIPQGQVNADSGLAASCTIYTPSITVYGGPAPLVPDAGWQNNGYGAGWSVTASYNISISSAAVGGGSGGANPSSGGGGGANSSGCMDANGNYVCPTEIDKYNPMERGKTNLRDFNVFCSTHVTIDQTTGQTATHVDLINPRPIPIGPVSADVLPILHVVYDGVPDLIYRVTGMYLIPPGRSQCQ